MSKSRFIEIPLFKATDQHKRNIWFCRPICFMDNICDEATCKAYQKENKDLDNICYLKSEHQ